MKLNLTLFMKLFIIIISFLVIPVMYFYIRLWWFRWTMQELLQRESLRFDIMFFLYKILFLLHIFNLFLFIIPVELGILLLLIEIGVVY